MRCKAEAPAPLAWPLDRGVTLALAVLTALTLWRFGLGLIDPTELSTDEAQYWAFGQQLSFGAASKPPLIGWLIRAETELFGQSAAAVRLGAVALHAAVAGALWALAARLLPAREAALAALLYATTPAVSLGASLMTTDTPLLLCATLALLAQHALAQEKAAPTRKRSALALGLGLAVGLGMLAKYAMLYALAGQALAALAAPAWRIARRDLALAGAVALALLAPHVAWIFAHDFITFRHLAATAGGPEPGLSLIAPLAFLASQFGVWGPILFPAALVAMARSRPASPGRGLELIAAAPLGIVCLQALGGKALANWAVLALPAGALLAAPLLAARPRLAAATLGLSLALALAFPATRALAPDLRLPSRLDPSQRQVFARYLGHESLARFALDTARANHLQTVIAQDRDLLADLEWIGRPAGLPPRAVPPLGPARTHWHQSAAFHSPPDTLPALLMLRDGPGRLCPEAAKLARRPLSTGFARGATIVLLRLDDPSCLKGPPRHE